MISMPISKFKATCLAVLEKVRQTGEPVLITKRGAPVAEIVPASRPSSGRRDLGAFADRIQFSGDVVSPATSAKEWEAIQ